MSDGPPLTVNKAFDAHTLKREVRCAYPPRLRRQSMTASSEIVLLGDIGATNARFALLTEGVLGPIKWIEVARYPKFADAVEDFLRVQFRERPVANALLAVAGVVEDERCSFVITGSQVRIL
jgi:hypothetical protein